MAEFSDSFPITYAERQHVRLPQGIAMLKRMSVLGYSLINESAEDIARYICDRLAGDRSTSMAFVFLNPHSVIIAERDLEFKSAVESAHGILCDGAGLSLAARALNHRRISRVYGFKFFTAISDELSRRKQGRVYFLGGEPATLAAMRERYMREYPGIVESHFHAPPYRPAFSDSDLDEMATRVNAFRPDVLWIGLGSPKQEVVLAKLMQRCQVGCGAAVGAVFDFYAGRIQPAPAVIRGLGLEWLHRLVREPRRLWKRTFVSGPLFALRVLRTMRKGS